MEKIRRPVVAGYFYPEEKRELLRMLERFIDSTVEPEKVTALIAPHAGYVYSGKTAGAVFSRAIIPDTVILIGPNHTGYGEPYAVDGHTIWSTPLGEVKVDTDLVDAFVKKSRYLQKDTVAHIKEHSLEVELPFIQFLKKDVKIVPVVLSGYVDDPVWYEIGESLAETVIEKGIREKTHIVASTDMTHYEEQSIAEEKDNYAIEAILALDELLLIDRLAEKNISMCGYGPVITSIIAAKKLGAKEAELVRYTTSGETTKDYAQVVGYAG
ncbi:MAG: AmmeMemoRadiSam system protein B, partial [Candidatus Omnitrophica bacterium]|nr:AmmeMemoRadiSam system protein B [Candidatus Omnitrophota bacterium]